MEPRERPSAPPHDVRSGCPITHLGSDPAKSKRLFHNLKAGLPLNATTLPLFLSLTADAKAPAAWRYSLRSAAPDVAQRKRYFPHGDFCHGAVEGGKAWRQLAHHDVLAGSHVALFWRFQNRGGSRALDQRA